MSDWDGRITEADVRRAFNEFDRDRNGYLGAADVSALFGNAGSWHTLQLIDELIKEADRSGDGQIGYGDFRKLCMELFPELRNAVRAKAAPGLFQNDGKPARAGVLGKEAHKNLVYSSSGESSSTSGASVGKRK